MRYVGCAAGFALGLVWMTVGLGSAIVCVLLAGLGYGAVFFVERARANAHTASKPSGSIAQALEEFELENETLYEQADDATSPLAAEADYGWPVEDQQIAHANGR
jgi:hypothetical protein